MRPSVVLGTTDEETDDATDRASQRRVFWVAAALSACTVAFGTAASTLEDPLAADTTFLLASAMGTAFSLMAALRASGARRVTFALLCAFLVCYTVADMWWFYYAEYAATEPFPSWADAFYIAGMLPGALALLVLHRSSRREGVQGRLLLDSLVLTSALALVSLLLVLRTVFSDLGSGLGAAVYAFYPISDLVVFSLAAVLILRTSEERRAGVVLISVGFAVFAAVDTAYTILLAEGGDVTTVAINFGYYLAPLLVGLGTLAPRSARAATAAPSRRQGGTPAAVLPDLAVLAAVALCAARGLDGVLEWVLAAAVLLLAGVRHVVTAADNLALRRGLERRVSERTDELAILSHRHERILHAVGEGIIEIESAGRITFANPIAAQLLGRSADDLVGLDGCAVLHAGQDHRHGHNLCLTEAVLAHGDVRRRGDETYSYRDERTFPVEVTASPRLDAASEVAGVVLVFRDITEQQAMERMKAEFISVVSHELRTPLTAIRGALGLFDGGAVGEIPPSAAHVVTIALRGSERLTRLVNDIVDIERLESGQFPLQLAALDAAALAETALSAVRPLADEAGIALELGSCAGTAYGDEDRLTQVLTNLLGNAIKFTPPDGCVRLDVHEGAREVTFAVSDTGRGIPDDQVDLVFERFQQVDAGDARIHEGAGLGLSISKSIVQRHGGRIWAESRLGAGSTFRFTVPVADPVRVQAPDAEVTLVGGEAVVPPVLVCDNDLELLTMLEGFLRERGYAARPVDGRAAEYVASAAGDQDTGAIVLRLELADGEDWAALNDLRHHPQLREIPIVGLADPTRAVVGPAPGAVEAAVAVRAGAGGVLVVEDDDDLAEILGQMFTRVGLGVTRASTQQQAIQQIGRVRPDVVVLDLLLAEGDGYGVVDALRTGGELAHVPIVVYSASVPTAQERRRLTVGETVFLDKGHTDPDALLDRVSDLIARVARRDRADRQTDDDEREAV